MPFLGSLKNLTTGLIWLVMRVGAGKGEMGGAPESSGSNLWAPLKPNNWSDLAGDEGGGDGGRRGEVAHGGRARGEMGGGAPESSVGATKVHF